MKEMKTQFIPRFHAITELFKEVQKEHAAYIVNLSSRQKELAHAQRMLIAQLKLEAAANPVADTPEFKNQMETFLKGCQDFETSAKNFRLLFGQQIDDTNFALGSMSTLWGGYIENLGVNYISAFLRKEKQAHTFIHKYTRHYGKNKGFEMDLLALSDTHAFVLEVKNQLKPEGVMQVRSTIQKMDEHLPEYKHLIKQPILVCMQVDENEVDPAKIDGIWILRYKGFDREKPKNSFEWLAGMNDV